MIERQNNVIFAVISNALGILIMLITTKAMTYYMTTAEYGEFRLIFNVASFLSLFLILGRDSLILTISDKRIAEALNECFYGIITVFIGVFILYVFSDTIITVFFKSKISSLNYYLGLLMILVWGIYNLLTPILRIKGEQNLIFLFNNFLLRFIRLPFFILLVYLNFQYTSSYYSMIIGQLLLTIVLVAIVIRKSYIKNFSFNLKNYFHNFHISFFICINTLMFTLMTTMVVMLANINFSMTFVGIIDMVVMLTSLMMYPFIAYIKTIEPYLTKNTTELEQFKFNKNKELSFIICLLSCVFLVLFSKFILGFFGNEYAIGYKLLIITSILFFFSSLLGPYPEWLNLNGYPRFTSCILILSIVTLFIVYYSLIDSFQYYTLGISLGLSILEYRFLSYLVYLKLRPNSKFNFSTSSQNWKAAFILITLSVLASLNLPFVFCLLFFITIAFFYLKRSMVIINAKHN
uniref:Wzx n=1 Tax=Providencia alcalifaciens TaxID=126385 RepID=F8RBZ3_9GAMM|nr:Wzx [Providencia alcalifaciens]